MTPYRTPKIAWLVILSITALYELWGLFQGYDYDSSNGRGIYITSSDWPDLTGSTVTLCKRDSSHTLVAAMRAAVVGTGSQTVELELTNTQTTAMSEGSFSYRVSAVLTDTRWVDLADVTLRVRS